MSTFGLIWIIGSIIAVFIVVICCINEIKDGKTDVTVKDLFTYIFITFICGCLSWVFLAIFILAEYGDTVIFKRRMK